jgi:molybdate transport system substrate-binding protein
LVKVVALLVCLGAMLTVPSLSRAIEIGCEPVVAGTPASATQVTSMESVPFPFPEGEGTLTVFAAASLVDAFARIEADLEAVHPGLDIVVETAGSQTLVTQLSEGAGADVLATADTESMSAAQATGLIAGTPIAFAGNRLVIVTPADNPAGIDALDDLAQDDLLLVIAGEDVPAGRYTRRAICATGDAGFVAAVDDNVVSEEEDVRGVLAKVQIGEADAGIVYASDAAAANLAGANLPVIEFPAEIDTRSVYPIAPVAGGNVDLANAFISYVMSEAGQRTLAEFGFVSPAAT